MLKFHNQTKNVWLIGTTEHTTRFKIPLCTRFSNHFDQNNISFLIQIIFFLTKHADKNEASRTTDHIISYFNGRASILLVITRELISEALTIFKLTTYNGGASKKATPFNSVPVHLCKIILGPEAINR